MDLQSIAAQAPDGPDRLWALLDRADEGWLLVLDNADQPELLAAVAASTIDGNGWARSSNKGLVVITSRHTDRRTWGRDARIEPIGPLGDDDAAQVLLDLAREAGDRGHAEALARRLGCLPLALHLAGTYLGSRPARLPSFAAYEEALDVPADVTYLLTPDPDTPAARDPRSTIMRTWELSLDELARRDVPQARPALRLLSCFAPTTPIPLAMLDSEAMTELMGKPPGHAWTRRCVLWRGSV
jgi:hypothetical protein